MSEILSDKKLHKIARINQAISDYFQHHPAVQEVPAKELMPLFIANGVFFKNDRRGMAIRNLLSRLQAAEKLHLISHCTVERNNANRHWYFVRKE